VTDAIPAHRRWQQFYQAMLDRRLPEEPVVRLNNRKLFIFPTATGFAYGLMLLLVWLLAVNYQNNLIFAFSFLLSSMFVVSILHTFANLSGLEVSVVATEPTFAGDRARVTLRLTQRRKRLRDGIFLYYAGSRRVSVAIAGADQSDVELFVTAPSRGWLQPGRLTIDSTYPLGLLRVWTHIKPSLKCLVYPRPVPVTPALTGTPQRGQGELEVAGGTEDFARLDAYRPGQSLRHVAWKQYARGQGMLTKQFTDCLDDQVWLDWNLFAGMDREARLSRLCGWLLAVSRGNCAYGLRMPGVELPAARGEQHRDRILRLLALFELPPP